MDLLESNVDLTVFDNIDDKKAIEEVSIILNNSRIYTAMRKEHVNNRKEKREVFPPNSDWNLPSFHLESFLPDVKYQCNNCSNVLITELDYFNHKLYPMTCFMYSMYQYRLYSISFL